MMGNTPDLWTMMNYSDTELTRLAVQINNILKDRLTDKVSDPWEDVLGQESAKRALMVAAAAKVGAVIIGPTESGKELLRAGAIRLGLPWVGLFSSCPCGNYGDPIIGCGCYADKILRHLDSFKDITEKSGVVIRVCRTTRDSHDTPVPFSTIQKRIDNLPPLRIVSKAELCPLSLKMLAQAKHELNISEDIILQVASGVSRLDDRPLDVACVSEAICYSHATVLRHY